MFRVYLAGSMKNTESQAYSEPGIQTEFTKTNSNECALLSLHECLDTPEPLKFAYLSITLFK